MWGEGKREALLACGFSSPVIHSWHCGGGGGREEEEERASSSTWEVDGMWIKFVAKVIWQAKVYGV